MNDSENSQLPSPFDQKICWKEGVLWLLALAAVRIGIMVAMGMLTGDRHFSDDWRGQLDFVRDPFQTLLVREGIGPQFYPPLQPIATWLLAKPFSGWLDTFYTIRCFSILGELLAWPFVWALFSTAIVSQSSRRLIAATYILAPICWCSTSLFAQEEPLSLLFLAATMYLVLKDRLYAAILTASFGVLTAKIFFLIPLLALVMATPSTSLKELVKRSAIAAGPIVLVHSFVVVNLWLKSKNSPFLEFTPHGLNSTSIWVLIRRWLELTPHETKRAAMVTGFLAGVTPLVVAKLAGVRCDRMNLVRIMVTMQLFVYMWFYHCDPEYYLIVTPGVLVSLPPLLGGLAIVGGFSIPFAINLFYGVARAENLDVGEGKNVFVEIYHRWIPLDPAMMHTVSILALCAFSLALTIYLTYKIATSPFDEKTPTIA